MACLAVKLLNRHRHSHSQQGYEQFMAEVSMLSRLYHRNIVRLFGYCVKGDAIALVYEYMVNGSLDKYLFDNHNSLDWETLQNIALGIAKGISYLQEECTEVIIHRDIKPSNILLGSNFSPKLADFGLALQYDKDDGDVNHLEHIAGTFGYMDPSYIFNGVLTCKSDVFGFGMVLFDILGRPKRNGNDIIDYESFPRHIWEKMKLGNLEYLKEQTGRLSMAALWCCQHNPEERPCMSTVVNILKGETEVMLPPYPFPDRDSYSSIGCLSISLRSEGITEFSGVLSSPNYESHSVLSTAVMGKHEIEMATSSDNLIMESKMLIPINDVISLEKNVASHNVSTFHPDNSSLPSEYMKSFPSNFVPNIQCLIDVKGDGNCGFRALAGLLGKTTTGWVSVRKDLRDELLLHWEEYSRLYEEYGSINRLKNALEYYNNNAPPDYWMDMPDMGHIIASFYDVVLVHISLEQCLTFLPLRSPPQPEEFHKIICIGFVNGNHFVQLGLHQGCPLPNIAERWHIYHHPCAKGWETPYTSRIKRFEELVIGENVALRETPTEICTSARSSFALLSGD